MGNKQITFKIDPVTFEQLETCTKNLNRPRSHIILEALKLYLNKPDDETNSKNFFHYDSIMNYICYYICYGYKNWDYIRTSNLWECGYTKILDFLNTRIIENYFYSQQLIFSDSLTYFFPIEIIDSEPVQIIFNRSLNQRSLAECDSAGSDRSEVDNEYINRIIIKEINKPI